MIHAPLEALYSSNTVMGGSKITEHFCLMMQWLECQFIFVSSESIMTSLKWLHWSTKCFRNAERSLWLYFADLSAELLAPLCDYKDCLVPCHKIWSPNVSECALRWKISLPHESSKLWAHFAADYHLQVRWNGCFTWKQFGIFTGPVWQECLPFCVMGNKERVDEWTDTKMEKERWTAVQLALGPNSLLRNEPFTMNNFVNYTHIVDSEWQKMWNEFHLLVLLNICSLNSINSRHNYRDQ